MCLFFTTFWDFWNLDVCVLPCKSILYRLKKTKSDIIKVSEVVSVIFFEYIKIQKKRLMIFKRFSKSWHVLCYDVINRFCVLITCSHDLLIEPFAEGIMTLNVVSQKNKLGACHLMVYVTLLWNIQNFNHWVLSNDLSVVV